MLSRWDTVSGLAMHTRFANNPLRPDCPPLVLVHGLSVSSRYMIPTAECLATDFTVYAPDLPGFGRSAQPAHAFNVADLADALSAWTKVVGLERAAFLGNSFGCQIIVEFALRYPEAITCAILVGPTTDRKGRTVIQQLWRALRTAPRERLSLIPIVLHDYLTAGVRRTMQTLQCSLQDRIEGKLPQVQIPMLVVHGARDRIVPQGWAEEVARLLPQGRLAIMPGAAHAPNYSHARQLVDVIRPFLRDGCMSRAFDVSAQL